MSIKKIFLGFISVALANVAYGASGGSSGTTTTSGDTYYGKNNSNSSTTSGTSVTTTANGNSITMKDGDSYEYVYGGKSSSSSNVSNSQTNNWGKASATSIATTITTANNNTITISGGILGNIYGGYAYSYSYAYAYAAGIFGRATATATATATSTASSNSVTITDGTITGNIYGGYANISATASAKAEGLTGSSSNATSSTTQTSTATASSNTITISGGTIAGNVYSGYANTSATTSKATENAVYVSDGTITGNIYGGYAKTASENIVYASGGTISTIYGGYGTSTASSNSVTITDGTISTIYGGYSSSTASENIVYASGGTISTIYGGYSSSTASENIVYASGGTISTIYGGYGTTASNNTININGAIITGDIYGGYGTSTANDNIINISDGSIITGNVYGWYSASSHTNNIINILGSATIGGNLANFEFLNINFTNSGLKKYINDFINGTSSSTYISIGGNIDSSSGTITITNELSEDSPLIIDNYSGSISALENTTFSLLSGNNISSIGSSIVLNGSSVFSTLIGSTMKATGTINTDDYTLSFDDFTIKDEVTSINQSNASLLAFTNQGADLVSTQIASQAKNAIILNRIKEAKKFMDGREDRLVLESIEPDETMILRQMTLTDAYQNHDSPFVPFGVLQGSWNDYEKANISLFGASLVIGLAKGLHFNQRLSTSTSAVFIEHGYGEYGTDFSGYGFSYYTGAGILEHIVFSSILKNYQTYIEASIRGGYATNSFTNNNIIDGNGNVGKLNASAYYAGGHIGLGYLYNITKKMNFDVYVKYLINILGSYETKLTTGDPINFESIVSNRFRFGVRFSYKANDFITPFFNGYYENEISAEAKAKTYFTYDIKSADLKGHSGIGELGISITPSVRKPLNINASIQGYGGVRIGVNGAVSLKYNF